MSIYYGFLAGSVLLDILANLSLQHSEGFRRRKWGVLAVALIMMAFALLALAVKGLPLFLAYAVWGAFSITGTALATRLVFGHRLNATSCAGLAVLIVAIGLMQVGGEV
ncbi:SMR family transporter [Sneathiella chinensis]|uniref:Spermidine export protein MdtI n=1 Tax=Sneathiella chinensis TaxID=349750 RepID=A0ABQ5U3U3_9PROT|nr:SMR family transporter [Sneathiella chinensis]GLQ06406.1 spermidine export protein MdtI [Sneathiella chinensis]